MAQKFEKFIWNEHGRAILVMFGTAIASAFGGGWTVYTYMVSQHEGDTTRRIEAQKPFLEKQLALYLETSVVAGRLITVNPDDNEWKSLVKRFEELYWAELAVVEDSSVASAMVAFRPRILEYETKFKAHSGDADIDKLRQSALHLSHAVRSSLEQRWTRRLGEP